MREEFSAGGIVFKKLKVAWLICQHSQHKGWVFPKGLIGDSIENEPKEKTAVREVKEETGIDAEIISALPTPVTYWYQYKKERIHKTVYFYLMQHLGGSFDDHDHEMMDVAWTTEQGVKRTLTYQNDKRAFEEALELYSNL